MENKKRNKKKANKEKGMDKRTEIKEKSITGIKSKSYAELRLDSRVYEKDVIFSAAYMITESAFVIIDYEESKAHKDRKAKNSGYYIVKIKAKRGRSIKKAVDNFNSELLSYAFYKEQLKKTIGLRHAILSAALSANISRGAVKKI